MANSSYRDQFISAADDWICNFGSIDIRYIAGTNDSNELHLWDASIFISPIPPIADVSFKLDLNNFKVGQQQLFRASKKRTLKLVEGAVQGQIEVYGNDLSFSTDQPLAFYSEMIHRDRWFCDLHLNVISTKNYAPSALDTTVIDNALRLSNPPFDGLADVSSWLGLPDPRQNSQAPNINIRIGPPVDYIIPNCKLSSDELHITLHAHPQFDTDSVGLAVRAIPGFALESRKQIGGEIKWGRARQGVKVGHVKINIRNADAVLIILMIGDTPVRRHWVLDQAKARNNRLIAFQNYDKDLTKVKQAVFNPASSDAFEKGICALFFLLGFAPALTIYDDSPDIVVMTPNGRLVVVECTTRIADFNSKLGKLVDRKGSLTSALQASSHHSHVDAILVCGLPKAQIARNADELKAHNIVFLTREDLEAGFDQLRHPTNPDEMLDALLTQMGS